MRVLRQLVARLTRRADRGNEPALEKSRLVGRLGTVETRVGAINRGLVELRVDGERVKVAAVTDPRAGRRAYLPGDEVASTAFVDGMFNVMGTCSTAS